MDVNDKLILLIFNFAFRWWQPVDACARWTQFRVYWYYADEHWTEDDRKCRSFACTPRNVCAFVHFNKKIIYYSSGYNPSLNSFPVCVVCVFAAPLICNKEAFFRQTMCVSESSTRNRHDAKLKIWEYWTRTWPWPRTNRILRCLHTRAHTSTNIVGILNDIEVYTPQSCAYAPGDAHTITALYQLAESLPIVCHRKAL